MMNTQNDYLLKKAQAVTNGKLVTEIKAPVKAYSLTELAGKRVEDRALEKLAPKTGYPELDGIIGGFVPGRLYTVSGDTNVGKTSIACNFAIRVARQDKKVLYFALEPDRKLVDYLASVRTNKKFGELLDEDLFADDGNIKAIMQEQVSTIEGLLEYVRDCEEHYDMVIVDHIGYFTRKEVDINQQQSNVLKDLAALSKEKMTAIMIIAELNKTYGGDGIPSLNQISGTKSFKYDSTEVLAVVREKESTDAVNYINQGKLFVLKTKHGPNGVVDLIFSERKANIMSIEEMNRFEQEEYADDVEAYIKAK